jgi:hypothetical protein
VPEKKAAAASRADVVEPAERLALSEGRGVRVARVEVEDEVGLGLAAGSEEDRAGLVAVLLVD